LLISNDEVTDMEPSTHPPVTQEEPKNWWQRNWKWFVPVGCLGVLVLFAALLTLIGTLVFGMIKSSAVYKDALATTRSNPAVVQALGTPIEPGILVMGSINISGSSGNADLAIPISGPNGKGTIYAKATRAEGKWTFSRLLVEIKESKEKIDLLEHGEDKEPPEELKGDSV
jgi:hypothetical protein